MLVASGADLGRPSHASGKGMTEEHHPNIVCTVCEKQSRADRSMPVRAIRPAFRSFLEHRLSRELDEAEEVCQGCLVKMRKEHLVARLERQRGALTILETEVADKAASHEAVATDLFATFERKATFGQKLAGGVARVGGSWPFVIGFLLFLCLWMTVNHSLSGNAFDPYPFILLNLVLSCIAALQAPIIMMSQNRTSARDRLQADQDFRINLKAELEVATLHEKIDHLLHDQWESMLEMQQAQLDLLNELAGHGHGPRKSTIPPPPVLPGPRSSKL